MSGLFPRRVYPLSARDLSEEELAAVFAMTSRSSQPLEEVAREVSPKRAAEFHRRWVLGRGHASVAEHAVVRLAVENISRLACDDLEDNRLGSYTEKSSRYQVFPSGFYHVPQELDGSPLKEAYVETCETLFRAYHGLMDEVTAHLRGKTPPRDGESTSAHELRLRHQAADSCRFLLPAATLTSVGVTMNARVLQHAIAKLLSSQLAEERSLGEELRSKGESLVPTLLREVRLSEYLTLTREAQREESHPLAGQRGDADLGVTLVHFDPDAERRVVAAVLYRFAGVSYQEVWEGVKGLPTDELGRLLEEGLKRIGPYESPIRELEYANYTFDFVMDYGAYREFKRHRMQTYVPQPLTIDRGYVFPELVAEAGQERAFREAIQASEEGFRKVERFSPVVAQYLVTHAHKRRVLSRMNLRQCYHFFRMRNSPHAHFTIRQVAAEAMRLVSEKHPLLLRHLRLQSR